MPKGEAIREVLRKINFRPYLSGLVPLFFFAHFGHHVVGAMLRPLMPMIRTELGLTYTQAGFTMSAFAVTSGLSQLPAGWLADRFSTRLMVILSITGVAIAGVFIGLSNSYVALIAFLVLAAILGGGYHPASAAAISSSVPDQYRGRALGFHFVGGSSTHWVVPLIAAPIAAAWSWRGAFLTLSIPTIIIGVLLYILIGSRMKLQASRHEDTNREVTTESARIPWGKLAPFIIISVAMGTVVQSAAAFLSLYAVDNLGVDETAAAMLMAIPPVMGLIAAPLGGYLSDRFGSIPVLLAISLLATPLVYLLGVVTSITAFVTLLVALGAASNTRMPASESYIAGNTPERRRATLLGLYFFAGTEVAGLLTPVMGNLIDRFGFHHSFAMASAAQALVVVACVPFLWKNRK